MYVFVSRSANVSVCEGVSVRVQEYVKVNGKWWSVLCENLGTKTQDESENS